MILAIDLGTTATKVSIVGPDMSVLASSQRRITTHSAPGGVSEQEARDWLTAVIDCVEDLHAQRPQLASEVEAMAVTGHMLGCLPVDAEGQPLSRHLLHGDTRSRLQSAQIEQIFGESQFYEMTGNRPGPSTLAKMLWFKQQQPEIYARTAFFLQSKDFVTGWLTGEYGTTDYSDASHACLINIHTLSYFDDVYETLGLDMAKLPSLNPGNAIVGRLCPDAAQALGLKPGAPVVAGAGDGACSAIGAGAAKAGDHYCCLGTTAWTACMAPKAVLDPARRNFNIVSGDGLSVGSFGTIQNAGRAIDWAQAACQVSSLKDFDTLAAAVEPGSNGLIFLPYLAGERSPHFDPDARGAFIGLGTEHETGHLLRAVLEGISMALRDTIDMHRDDGLVIDSLHLIGGGGKSGLWRQILADVLGVPVSRLLSPSEHATTVGAAILAGTAIGLFADLSEGAACLVRLDTLTPDETAVRRYEQLHAIYRQLYATLKPIHGQLAEYRNCSGC
jgi:xylulokinase